MKHLLLLLPLAAVGCAQPYSAEYAAGYESSRNTVYASGYGANEGYTGSQYAGGYSGGENCGTPEAPRACPPLPRHPLPYYPGDRN